MPDAECGYCEEQVGPGAVQDENEVFWLGKAKARVFCNDECLSNAGERESMAYYAANLRNP